MQGVHREAQSLTKMRMVLEKETDASHARLKDYKLMLADICGLNPSNLEKGWLSN